MTTWQVHADRGTAGVGRVHSVAARSRLTPRQVTRRLRQGAGVIALVAFSLFPAYWMVSTAVDPQAAYRGGNIIPSGFTWKNFEQVVQAGFFHQMGNSAFISVVTVSISMFVSLLASIAVARFRFRGRKTVLVIVLIAQMIPQEALVIPLFLQASSLGMLNSLIGLSIVYLVFSLPFAVWTMRGFVTAVPQEVEEAAWVDGASWWQTFRYILFPLVMPGLVSTSIFSFITAWNEFIFALTFLQDDSLFTVAIGLQRFFGENTADWGPIMAASTLISLPVVIFFMLIQRNLVSGLSAGAVKG